MSFDVMLRQMTAGFGQTCLIFFMTLIFSLPLGMLVYFGRVSRIKPISWIVKIYISIMRGTPLMLQLLVWYFAPYYLSQQHDPEYFQSNSNDRLLLPISLCPGCPLSV